MKNNPKLYLNETKYYKNGVKTIGGIDEVGRGSWAGPLVVGVVIFPKSYKNPEINDSKKLNKKKRDELYDEIKKNAIYCETIFISSDKIDACNNIKTSTRLAMIDLIKKSKKKADIYLIDAEKITVENTEIKEYTKADEKFQSVAAASIVAKVERDRYMIELSKTYKNYGFDKHVGYGTKIHVEALNKYGIIPHIHRTSFTPIKSILNGIKEK
jgi:ribonuclease HII